VITLPPLRDYQTKVIEDARAEVLRIKGRRRPEDQRGVGVLIQMATGAGKTLTGLHIIQKPLAQTQRVLWLAAKEELVRQPADALHKYGFASRILTRGEWRGHLGSHLTVATIQSLLGLKTPPAADFIVFDEARHFVAAEWGKLAGSYGRALRIGLDATPARNDGAALGDLFDALVCGPSVEELVMRGFLVPSTIYAPKKRQDKLAELPVEAYKRHALGKRAILYASSVVESKRQALAFEKAGFRAAHVDGKSLKEARGLALNQLASGQIDVLCNCAMFTEGLDVPSVECAIIARGVSNESTWIQIGGRVLRPSPETGKQKATIIDLFGHVNEFGLMTDHRTYHLDGSPIRRQAALPSAVQCKNCLGWGAGSTCASCGHSLPPPPPPKLSRAELDEIKKSRQDKLAQSGTRWEFWCEVVRESRVKGWAPSAAFMRFKTRFGHTPPWRMDQVQP
jgi:superfamily II DNA or RNA helicase